ncbi:MAG: hypothetical protein FWE46_00010 [Coriobacteriia bacterium]|nr:hypothetical protein [Coriobacteriia bacterium]MCL2536834.1 hypothetical protein [Coriobacteriia bacterium]
MYKSHAFEGLGNKKFILALLAFALIMAAAIGVASVANVAGAVPGAETAQDAQAEIDARAQEAMAAAADAAEPTEEEIAAATAAAEAAVTPDGFAPVQAMWIVLFDDAENGRTTVSLQGAIDPYTPLPAKVKFYFADDYVLESAEQVDFDSGDVIGDISHDSAPSESEDFENLTTYTLELTEGHVFNVGFSIPVQLFATEAQMGDSPLASFSFVPADDLYGLVVGFVSPSPDLVGAGGQEQVQLIGETEEGEVYGIVRENVAAGELQEYLIAFGSRADRDAALAAAAEAEAASVETTPSAFAWFTTPTGMTITGVVLVLVIAAGLAVWLGLRGRGAVVEGDDGDDDGASWGADGDWSGNPTAEGTTTIAADEASPKSAGNWGGDGHWSGDDK